MRTLIAAAAASLTMLACQAASAATYAFTQAGPAVAVLRGDGFTVSPGAYGVLNFAGATVTRTNRGLGVNGRPDTNPNNIDGFPLFSAEYLEVTFDRAVRLVGFTLGNVDRDDDVDVFFDDDLFDTFNVAANNPFTFNRVIRSFIVKASGTPGRDGFGNDDFTLASFEVAAVSVPAGGLMLVAGLGALAGLRRRKAAVA